MTNTIHSNEPKGFCEKIRITVADYQEKNTFGEEGSWRFGAFGLEAKGSDLLI
jgi:hypothetical protein